MSNSFNNINEDSIEELINQIMTPEMVKLWKDHLNLMSQEEANKLQESIEKMYKAIREDLE